MGIIELYLEGKVDVWFQGLKLMKRDLDWDEFSEKLLQRFSERGIRDEIEEFNKLQQTGTVLEYQERFEELKSLLLTKDPRLPETYFISSFISGLREELKPAVRMMKPVTLQDAFDVAQLQEQTLDLSAKRFRNSVKSGSDLG